VCEHPAVTVEVGASPVAPTLGVPAPPARPLDPRLLLVSTICGVIAFSSSMTIVSAVLGDIAEDLGSSAATVSWAVTGLFLTMAIGTPVMGRIGDAVGRRPVFIAGTVIITVAMVLCVFAWNAASFIGFRMLTGLGIACAMPNGMAMVINAHPPERRPQAIGWFQMVMTGAPVFALVIGAWLTEALGWRAVFVLLAPIAAAGMVLGIRNVHDAGTTRSGVTVDWWGAGGLGTATLLFLLSLERVKAADVTDPLAGALFAGSLAALAGFIAVERRVAQPLLRLDYFRRRDFSGPLIAQTSAQFAYMGGFVMTPLMLRSEFGLGVAASSWLLLFRPGVYSISSPLGGRLATQLGQRLMVLSGTVLIVVSMMAFSIGAAGDALWVVVAGLVMSGLAMGLATPSYSTSIAAVVDPADLGVANGMSSTLMNLGMLTGIQTMFVLLGDRRTGPAFAGVFLVGALVAAAGIIGALIISRPARAPMARPDPPEPIA
jgi:predicted MFS family arabinose efflux permease